MFQQRDIEVPPAWVIHKVASGISEGETRARRSAGLQTGPMLCDSCLHRAVDTGFHHVRIGSGPDPLATPALSSTEMPVLLPPLITLNGVPD